MTAVIMTTKPKHTTMQNTAAVPAARHTDPADSRCRQRGFQRSVAANSMVRSHLTAVGSIMTGGSR